MSQSAHPSYRPDIDGLRAIAVGSVLLFHAFPAILPGGFIGVDVFFVISGFLISTILLNSLEQGRFSLADFYGRRVRRIFPALLLVLLACYAFGWFSLLADEYKQLGSNIAAGAGFSSNFLLWSQTGYFDNAAETKPLLHLWSLGIEEQFYVFWPLLLALVHKRRWSLLPIIIVLGLGSFATSIYLTGHDPAAGFYSPLSRFWELMVGGALAYLSTRRSYLASTSPDLKAWAGLALLVVGFVLLDSKRAFPGWWALLPAWGAFLLLAAGPGAWFNRKVLASRPMVWIGLISYPLYLWHWPLLSFARIFYGEEPPVEVRTAALAASVGLAIATYAVVEKRVRSPGGQAVKARGLAAGMCIVGFVGMVTFWQNGIPSKFPEEARYVNAAKDWHFPGDMLPMTILGRDVYELKTGSKDTTLFIGDSNAEQYYPRVLELTKKPGAHVDNTIFSTVGGCSIIPGITVTGPCIDMPERGIELAKTRPDVKRIVIASSWYKYLIFDKRSIQTNDGRLLPIAKGTEGYKLALDSFDRYLKQIKEFEKTIYVVLNIPYDLSMAPRSMIARSLHDFPHVLQVQVKPVFVADQNKRFGYLDDDIARIAAQNGAIVLTPRTTLCDTVECPVTSSDGQPLYKDATHLRSTYAATLPSFIDAAVLK